MSLPSDTEADDISTDELATVARHGTSPVTRALAVVLLAKRHGREEKVLAMIDEEGTE